MKRFELPLLLIVTVTVHLAVFRQISTELSSDAADYHRLAVGLVEQGEYTSPAGDPTSLRPPGYPAFVAAVYTVAGVRPGAVRWVQLFLGIGLIFVTRNLATRLFGAGCGRFTGWLLAVNLGTVSAAGRVQSELLFAALLLLTLLTIDHWLTAGERQKRRLVLALVVGALLGVSTLVRGVLLLLPPLLAVVLWLGSRQTEFTVRSRELVLMLVAFGVTLMPWTVRNYRVHDAFVPVATQVGITLYSSYFPPDGWRFGVLADDEVVLETESMGEAEASSYLTGRTVRRVLESPMRIVGLSLRKALFFWVPLDWEVLPWYGALNPTYILILLGAAGLGIQLIGPQWVRDGVRDRLGGERARVALVMVAYLFAMAIAFYGSPRLRIPIEPILAIYAGVFFHRRMLAVGRRRFGLEAGAVVLGVAVLAVFLEPLKALARAWMAGA